MHNSLKSSIISNDLLNIFYISMYTLSAMFDLKKSKLVDEILLVISVN